MPNHSVNEVREDRRLEGKIARLNNGYGFIEGINGKDYFFHWSELIQVRKAIQKSSSRRPSGISAWEN